MFYFISVNINTAKIWDRNKEISRENKIALEIKIRFKNQMRINMRRRERRGNKRIDC
jgi:hypothetical protein